MILSKSLVILKKNHQTFQFKYSQPIDDQTDHIEQIIRHFTNSLLVMSDGLMAFCENYDIDLFFQ